MAERIKKKIEELHNKYTLSSGSPRVSGKKYKHFPSLSTNSSEAVRVIKCYFTGYGGNFNYWIVVDSNSMCLEQLVMLW